MLFITIQVTGHKIYRSLLNKSSHSYLPHGITQFYLSPDTSEHNPP